MFFLYGARDSFGNKTKLMGVVAVHVDDLIITGRSPFEAVLTKMKNQLTFGKWFVREFDYLGASCEAEGGFCH